MNRITCNWCHDYLEDHHVLSNRGDAKITINNKLPYHSLCHKEKIESEQEYLNNIPKELCLPEGQHKNPYKHNSN